MIFWFYMFGDEDEDEITQCALFDFDGILYTEGPHWKITNPLAGRIGSFLHWQEASRRFQTDILTRKPEARLSDYFRMDDYSAPAEELRPGVNIMPMDSITQTARSHIYRQRRVYLLTARHFRGQEEFHNELYEQHRRPSRPGEFPFPEKPFEKAPILYPRTDTPFYKIDPETSIRLKLDIILSLLTIADTVESAPSVANLRPGERGKYKKVFLYHTEKDFGRRIDDFLQKERSRLPDGKNAVVPFYIADMASINLYEAPAD